jgi:ribosomal-protein-serine acetyltransferase
VRGKIVGQIGFHGVDWTNKSINIGYWLGQSAEGKGLMTRSCRVFVNHAFDQMRLNRVQINCAEGNLKSRAVAERLGFRLEGTLRQTQWLHDHFENVAIYGVLRDEWSGEN